MNPKLKRTLIFIGLAAVLMGLRLRYAGLAALVRGGEYTAFDECDREITYAVRPPLGPWNAYERVDLVGGRDRAQSVLSSLDAEVLACERVGDIVVYYARSPRLIKSVSTRYGAVNLMIAASGERVTVGSPLIKGSF